MSWAFLLIFGSMFALGATAIMALFWAGRNGQFSDMKNGARVIFDEDEPVGSPTDVVFESRKEKRLRKATSETATK